MTSLALLLVLLAAGLHASWNYCAKRAGGGLPFVWSVGAVICAGYLPVLIVFCARHPPAWSTGMLLWILGSGLLKTGYTLFLQRAYRTGDFSLIYPLARGTGPLLSTFAAVVVLGERPPPLAIAGGLLIVGAIFWLTGGIGRLHALFLFEQGRAMRPPIAADATGGPQAFSSVAFGLLSGAFIAGYTIWDQHGVAALAIAPVVYDGGTSIVQCVLQTPFAVSRWPEVRAEWRTHKRWIFGVALLSPTAYVLVLTAMRFTPVSYVAPAREVSIVIGAFIGARLLKESDGRRRLLAAAAMAAGVIVLALA